MAHQEAVPGARRVVVVLLVVVDQPVVRGVVDALEAQRRAELVALGGVVVDDVEDDLDVGLVQGLDHRLELGDLLTTAAARVAVVRREEADRVVAPVVAQTAVLQGGVLHELVHRHQLDGGDAERGEVVDDRRVRDGGIGAADLLGHLRVGHRHALDVRLVDDRLVVLVARRAVVAPVEVRVDDHREHRLAQVVVGVALLGVLEVVGEQRLVVGDLALDRLGVRVEQQLARVAAVAPVGVVRAVHPEAVALAGLQAGHVGVPDEAVDLGQVEAGLGAVVVDEAQLDPLGHLAEQGEVDATAVVGGAEGVRRSGPDLHWLPSVCGQGPATVLGRGRASTAFRSPCNLPSRNDVVIMPTPNLLGVGRLAG